MSPRPLTDTGTNEQRIAELVFSGPWGRLAGGDVQWSWGPPIGAKRAAWCRIR